MSSYSRDRTRRKFPVPIVHSYNAPGICKGVAYRSGDNAKISPLYHIINVDRRTDPGPAPQFPRLPAV
jgi:hypothetical protein